ncbi:MAG TPA: sodium:solute symporter [Gemmatimonadaceae bacterium]|nr:sodium:solute symporter [Gemmatimonadaceae bacterium]
MHFLDWSILIVYLGYVGIDGIRRTRRTTEIEGYLLANRSLPWWAVGLSVMATQLSAITMIGTTGQGATDGLRFVQFYFGLPLAMVILGVTLVPFLHGARVFTAYEYLEKRFDAKTRTLTAFLFLLSRGMSCGTILAAPAVVFSSIFGWPISYSVAIMGVPTVLYTIIGGVQAVTWADVKQMVIVVVAIGSVIVVILMKLPVSPDAALSVAGSVGRLRAFDFRFDITQQYTFWSGLIGGTFLMMSYFGTDQSQVQRFLTAKSVDQARSSLLISAYWKIPLQAGVLLVGILVFVFYLFQAPPMLFNPTHDRKVREAQPAQYQALATQYSAALEERNVAARGLAATKNEGARESFRGAERKVEAVRTEALALAERVTGEPSKDVNYIIPHFVLFDLPIGLTGIFIASVMAAAMSAVAGELNSLATATTIDFYRRWVRRDASDGTYVKVSKIATGFWGFFACIIATYAANLGSLIEVVNRFGSFFYGSILGVFLLAMVPRSRALGAFVGLITGMLTVAAVNFGRPDVAFLWHNVVGAVTVVVVGLAVSTFVPAPRQVAR